MGVTEQGLLPGTKVRIVISAAERFKFQCWDPDSGESIDEEKYFIHDHLAIDLVEHANDQGQYRATFDVGPILARGVNLDRCVGDAFPVMIRSCYVHHGARHPPRDRHHLARQGMRHGHGRDVIEHRSEACASGWVMRPEDQRGHFVCTWYGACDDSCSSWWQMEPDHVRAFLETSAVVAEGMAEFDPLNIQRLRRMQTANAETH